MGIIREDHEEVTLADDQVGAGAIGITRGILGLVIRDGFLHLRKRLATDEFRADDGNLDVGIPPMGLIPLRVHETGLIRAHPCLHTEVQRVRPAFHLGCDIFDLLKRHIQRRRQALV